MTVKVIVLIVANTLNLGIQFCISQ